MLAGRIRPAWGIQGWPHRKGDVFTGDKEGVRSSAAAGQEQNRQREKHRGNLK